MKKEIGQEELEMIMEEKMNQVWDYQVEFDEALRDLLTKIKPNTIIYQQGERLETASI